MMWACIVTRVEVIVVMFVLLSIRVVVWTSD